MSYCVIVQQESFCTIVVFYCSRDFDFSIRDFVFSLMPQDCSRHRLMAPCPSFLSLFICCDLKRNSLWAFLFFNREKEELLVNREMSVSLLITAAGADSVGVEN